MFELKLENLPFLVTAGVGILTAYLLYKYSTRNHDYFKKKGIPFVKPFPFVGSLLQFIGKPIQKIEHDRYKTYGKLFGHFEGNRPVLSIGKPSLLRDIFTKNFQVFSSRRHFETGDKVMDSSLPILRGDDWKRVRAIVTPTFNTDNMKKVTHIFRDSAMTLIANLKRRKGEDIEAKSVYEAFTMDVIASSVFSTKIDSHNEPDHTFVMAARKILSNNVDWRILLFLIAPGLTKLLRIDVFGSSSMKYLNETILKIVESRRRTGERQNDFLQLLLDTSVDAMKKQVILEKSNEKDILDNYEDEPNINHAFFTNATNSKKTLSTDELIAQCVVFFAAGYGPTASTLTCCSYLLASNQDIQDKVREEVDSIIKEYGGELTYDGVQQMRYLDNVISETLRIFPPGVRNERLTEADYELGDTGITISKGMIITVPIYGMHRDPELFPDPEKFDPDRFTSEEKRKRDQYVYLPFGAGPRNCVGMRFALMEIKVCIALIIATFRLKNSLKTKLPLEFCFGQGLLQPKEIYNIFEVREDCPLAY